MNSALLLAQDPMPSFVIGGAAFGLLILLLLIPFAFWVWMLIDCVMSPTLQDLEKVLWFCLMVFLPLIGSVVYFLGGRGSRRHPVARYRGEPMAGGPPS